MTYDAPERLNLKQRVFNIVYVIAKGITYVLMLAAVFGVFYGIWVMWHVAHMTR